MIEVDDDVTEQRRAEGAVRTSESRYRALVAASARIVWTTSADGREPGDMSQWVEFTGQSTYEAGGGGWIRLLMPEDQAEAARVWGEALRERTPLVTQHRLLRRDGQYRHMEFRAVPVLDELGKVREWVGSHTDVTDRVKAEEQLAQAQKLQAVGTLAGGVAHEVNNQLMAVLGFGDFVVKELGTDHPQTKDVEEMIRAAMRAAQIAQQLLTFSRRQVNQARRLSVHDSVATLAPVLERILGADKSLLLQPTRSQSQIMADPTQIDQVLINLAANARDAMGTSGRLTIATDEVTLDESYGRAHGVKHVIPGPYVRLTVSDTGCGMDRATLAKVFEPFFTTKPVGSGTGLGLSTVYGIVKQHDGFVWAYSELGLGTVIKLYFPVATAAAAAPARGGARGADGSNAARARAGPRGRGRGRRAPARPPLARGRGPDRARGRERQPGARGRRPAAGAPQARADGRDHARAERPGAERAAGALAARSAGPVHVRLYRRRRPRAQSAARRGRLHSEAVRARGAGRPGAGDAGAVGHARAATPRRRRRGDSS